MNNEFYILTSYIGNLMMSRPIYNNTEVLKSVAIEIERLKEGLLFSFNQAQNRFQVTEYLNSNYLHLIALADLLWERAREHNPIARSALLMVVSLMDFIRVQYGNFLDKNHALTAFELFVLKNYVSTQIGEISGLMTLKQVTEPLNKQIVKAFQDFFNLSKHAVINCVDRKYINDFLLLLSLLAHDQRDKNWNLRLRLLLIKHNFNHMGIYKVLERELEKQVASIKSYKMQHQLLYEQTMWLEQVQVFPEIGYNRESMSLKALLMKHIMLLKEHLNEQRLIIGAENDKKLKHNLSVDEMALAFHYNHGEQVYDYKTKKAAAEVFCSYNQSMGTTETSVKSFLNFDRMNRSAAVKLYQRMGRIQKKLAEDFDL